MTTKKNESLKNLTEDLNNESKNEESKIKKTYTVKVYDVPQMIGSKEIKVTLDEITPKEYDIKEQDSFHGASKGWFWKENLYTFKVSSTNRDKVFSKVSEQAKSLHSLKDGDTIGCTVYVKQYCNLDDLRKMEKEEDILASFNSHSLGVKGNNQKVSLLLDYCEIEKEDRISKKDQVRADLIKEFMTLGLSEDQASEKANMLIK